MAGSKVRIRDAEGADQEAIRRVLLSAYEQYRHDLPESRWSEYRENIAHAVDTPGPTDWLVAERDGTIVGSVTLFNSSLVAYGRDLGIESPIVRLLAVAPEARSQGVATALLREAARRAKLAGAETLHLHTSDMMASAVRLYERLGFERATDKDIWNGDTLVKSYRLRVIEAALLES
ncbi:GNAT family N-acetyltransferase [Cohnella nanjingensis]|uniref:GNAT family N-acetyltransferase n=1 Tax=Cohnella nanjingensis TaxID=1387779 RepID=A0A7X0RWX4_9BACL|nr:GNAT family N-acetyltransferase [Cohnella nanjingensis]MBB6675141.1 GNAT family N-acetyltransferase [Cohnella nanjingensis]